MLPIALLCVNMALVIILSQVCLSLRYTLYSCARTHAYSCTHRVSANIHRNHQPLIVQPLAIVNTKITTQSIKVGWITIYLILKLCTLAFV